MLGSLSRLHKRIDWFHFSMDVWLTATVLLGWIVVLHYHNENIVFGCLMSLVIWFVDAAQRYDDQPHRMLTKALRIITPLPLLISCTFFGGARNAVWRINGLSTLNAPLIGIPGVSRIERIPLEYRTETDVECDLDSHIQCYVRVVADMRCKNRALISRALEGDSPEQFLRADGTTALKDVVKQQLSTTLSSDLRQIIYRGDVMYAIGSDLSPDYDMGFRITHATIYGYVVTEIN